MGCRGESYIISVHDGSRVVGIAPLSIEDHTASFLGNPNVCDYQDIVVVPGYEKQVMTAVASHLKVRGIRRMELQTLRPEAAALRALQAMTVFLIEARPSIEDAVKLKPGQPVDVSLLN